MRPRQFFLVAIVCLAMPILLYRLATICFTPEATRRFIADDLLGTLRWLGLSPDGNRVATFVMLACGIVAVTAMIKSVIVHTCGGQSAWGWVQVVIGLGLAAGGGFGWHLDHVTLLWAGVMIVTGWVLISMGANNIRLGKWMKYFMS